VNGLRKPSRFAFTGLPATPREQRQGPQQPGEPERPAARCDPVAALLHDLRGREVTLQVGGRLVTGRLITVSPVIVVDAEGRSTLVRTEAIAAVTF